MAKQSKTKSQQPPHKRKRVVERKSAAASFADIAWTNFDAVAVCEILTQGPERFPHERELLLRAFGGWVIGSAPVNKKTKATGPARDAKGDGLIRASDLMRKRAIRIGVRLLLAEAEKNVLEAPAKEWAQTDVPIHHKRLGDDFLRQAYYGIGGAAELGVSSASGYISRLKQSYLNAFETYIEMFHTAHVIIRLGESNERLTSKFFDAHLAKLAGNYKDPHLTLISPKREEARVKLLDYQTLRRRKYLDIPRAVLLYAAYLTPIEGNVNNSNSAISRTLVGRFFDPALNLNFDIPKAVQEWLSCAVFIRDTILPVFDGKGFELSGGPFDDSHSAADFVQGLSLPARTSLPSRSTRSRKKAYAKVAIG